MTSGVAARVHIDEAKLRERVGPIIRRRANVLAGDIRDEAKRIAPIRTGRLRRSIRASRAVFLGPMHVEASVTAHTRYARFVHEGTRPHVIRARRAKALHFFWEKQGREVFFKSVNHPGTRANPFLTIAGNRVALRHRYR